MDLTLIYGGGGGGVCVSGGGCAVNLPLMHRLGGDGDCEGDVFGVELSVSSTLTC